MEWDELDKMDDPHSDCSFHFSKVAVQLYMNKQYDINLRNLFFPLLRPDRQGSLPFKFSARIKYYSFLNKNDIGYCVVEIDKEYLAPIEKIRGIVEGPLPTEHRLFKVFTSTQKIRIMKVTTGFSVLCDLPVYIQAIPGILTNGSMPSICCKCDPGVYLPFGFFDEKKDLPTEHSFIFNAIYISPRKVKEKFEVQFKCSYYNPLVLGPDDPWGAIFKLGIALCENEPLPIEQKEQQNKKSEIEDLCALV